MHHDYPKSSMRLSKYFDIILAGFIATLIISNIGSTKIVSLGPLTFDGGTILFPLAYVLGSVITEVYGYYRMRRAIWIGFAALALMAVTLGVINLLPAAPSSTTHDAFSQIAGFVPRIVLASLAAYLVGQFVNATIVARLKVKTKGKDFWLRSFTANSVAHFIDTLVFSLIAFGGVITGSDFVKLVATVYLIKVVFEIAALPFSSAVVRFLKKNEKIDVYEKKEQVFNPF